MLPAMQAVVQTAEQPAPSVLQLMFLDTAFNTRLRFSEGQITGIRSQLLPAWSTMLLHAGVNPDALAQAQLRSRKVEEVLADLLQSGQIEAGQIAQLTRQRVLGALLPLVWRSGMMQANEVAAHPLTALTGADALQSVSAAEEYAGSLGQAEQALRPSARFVASPLADAGCLESEEATTVYLAALHGLSLGEMAARHALRWDTLTRTVVQLTAAGALYPERRLKPAERVAASRLRVGDLAPEFCLPDFGGGQIRLSELRGQKVWLIFNRQSTCALCNPHNIQIMALHGKLRQSGVQIVSVWGSTLADLSQGIGKLRPPYPVLADPFDETYDRYGLAHSLKGFLDVRNLSTAVTGLRMMGLSALKDDGELTRMPAEFLINEDGVIEAAHYNSYGVDWLPTEQVLDWAGARQTDTLA